MNEEKQIRYALFWIMNHPVYDRSEGRRYNQWVLLAGKREKLNRDKENGLIAPKAYRFKLQTVLDYRTEQLNQVQQKVAEEEHKRVQIQRRIEEYDASIEQAFREQQENFSQGLLDPAHLEYFPNYIWRLKQSRFQEFQRMQAHDQILMKLREELKQALIKKKSLDILKDKDYAKYRYQIEKAEEELMAEIALSRALRKQHSS